MKIGIVGCGNISDIYLKNLTTVFDNTTVYAVCDLDAAKANLQAQKYHIANVLTLEEMLADPEVEIVLNITTPKTHYEICKKALLAGKHVYVEKPLSVSYREGKELLSIAKEKGLYIGGAPDTFLGAGLQTATNLINRGAIGKPVGGAAYMLCPGHESWHPSPEFYYDIGGGPLFDMGPYYMKPRVIIFDESTAMLDPQGRQEVVEIMEKLNREENITVINITHYMEEAARADRVIVVNDGRVAMDGSAKEVFREVDKLHEMGLEAPQGRELIHSLNAAGLDLSVDALSDEECIGELLQYLKSGKV